MGRKSSGGKQAAKHTITYSDSEYDAAANTAALMALWACEKFGLEPTAANAREVYRRAWDAANVMAEAATFAKVPCKQ